MIRKAWGSCSQLRFPAILAIFLVRGNLACAEAAGKPLSSGLRAADDTTRLQAEQDLRALRTNLFMDLRMTVERDANRSWDGPRHLAIRQMGLWRFVEASSLLAANVDWSLDKETLPKGKKISMHMLYPAAIALRDIGGKYVRGTVTIAIRRTDDEAKLRLLGWVLFSIDGVEVAEPYLDRLISKAWTPEVKRRLEKAKRYMKKGTAVFADLPDARGHSGDTSNPASQERPVVESTVP